MGILACSDLITGSSRVAADEPSARKDTPLEHPRAAPRALLAAARTWGCQYQNIRIEELAASDLELIVVEPLLDGATWQPITPDEIARLKRRPDGSRRLVFAYLCVGEASSARPYWDGRWHTDPPAWLGPSNSEWPGAYAVRHWDPAWRDIVLSDEPSGLGGILSAGYDGAFLDRVDGYMTWQKSNPVAGDSMVSLISEIASTAQKASPGFLLMSQNAEMLLERSDYRQQIDAVSKESLIFGLKGESLRNPESDIAWSRTRLEIAKASGLPIFTIEYLSEPKLIAEASAMFAKWDYRAFFGVRLLDRLPNSHRA